ncbi:hypothetical protein DPMN_044272 [Dreissena polymorpha]|uniref:Uncharacterized protein n=1 Tax=Dreissena polymorpha TaxID=45954 RepID=A0A9D4HYK4_DREPO|nr:hypothetical protein DPMN_044272 [Dreissena polymorpha]
MHEFTEISVTVFQRCVNGDELFVYAVVARILQLTLSGYLTTLYRSKVMAVMVNTDAWATAFSRNGTSMPANIRHEY